MRTRLLPLLAGMALLAACDKVDNPLGTDDTPVPVVDGVPRKVLLEDLTGHRCPNCPQAAGIAEDLQELYGDQLVVVGVHMMTVFAAPGLPLGDDSLDTDFRTPAGDTYEDIFDVPSLPKGLVDRKPYNNVLAISRDSWSSAVAQLMGQEAEVKLWFDTLHFDPASRTATFTVKGLCAKPISGPRSLTIYLTEDHVIDGQIDNQATPPYIPDYDHRHVLRDNVNGTWGEAFMNTSTAVGDTVTKSFTYTLSSNVVEPANCAFVAYTYSTSGADQYEVKQVEERKVQE